MRAFPAFPVTTWRGICSNPNTDRTVFVDLQKSLTRAPLGCDHVSQNRMTAACACWPLSPDKPVKQIHLFRPSFSKALKYMLQIFFPERLLACSELSMCLTALLSAQQTSDGAVCAAAVLCQVPCRLQNCSMKNIFINLASSSTGALVPGSEMSQSFCREVGLFPRHRKFLVS